MPVRMTETAINKAMREAVNGNRRDLADSGCPGLRLRLTPGGAATWVLACRDRHGRMRRFPLGRYPATGISDARNKARELHTRVRQEGADPIADRRRDRVIGAAAKVGEGTLSALLALYERQRGTQLKRWAEAKRSMEVVFKPLLGRPLVALKSQDFQMLADGYNARHAAGAAVRYVRPVLKWGATRGYIGTEVACSPSSRPGQAAQANSNPRGNRCGAAGPSRLRPPLWRRDAVHAADADPTAGNRTGALARREHGSADLDHPRDEEWRDARRALVPAGDGLAAVPTAG